ncbi:MAG: hypothetical protein Q9P44_15475, partial [Anaerolineae bacterium]|nr:hypothetical protein [Anaerolineae bacterium]
MVRPSYRALMLLIWILIHSGLAGLAIYSWLESRPPTREEAFPRGEIVVGVDASFPPFAVDNGV